MKRFFTFAILTTINIIAISAQNEYCIAKIDNNSNIIVCNNMIDAFSAEDIINVKQFSITNHSNIFVNEKKYDINIGCINDWDNYDGGMFNVISVSKDNNTLLEIKQPDCWTFTYGGKSETDFHKYTNNQYYIPIEISNNLSILIFVGWPYGGELPLLTILALTDSDVKLVFNKHMAINSITKDATNFAMEVISSIVEHDANNNAINQSHTHRIYSVGNDIFYK